MEQKELIINLGSQSKKYALAQAGKILARAHLEPGVNLSEAEFSAGLELVLKRWQEAGTLADKSEIGKIAIRIVAPGTFFSQHRLIDADYKVKLATVAEMWPLHLAPVLAELDLISKILPTVPVWGLSDSAFHQTMPDKSRLVPINQDLTKSLDLYRFGYHGLSVGSIVRELRASNNLPHRIIVAHLGGGVSVTALESGKTLETSMGYTPLGGVPMSTRVGEMDPGALIYLLEKSGLSPGGLLRELELKSGLLAISGSTSEVRELLEQEKSGDQRAGLALEIMVNGVLKYLGGYVALLGGVDLIILTGTIAERSEIIQNRLREHLAYLGLGNDQIKVMPTDELAEMSAILGEV